MKRICVPGEEIVYTCIFLQADSSNPCGKKITFTIPELEKASKTLNPICPDCRGSVFFEITKKDGRYFIDGPKVLSLA